jgi:hypothetical protein
VGSAEPGLSPAVSINSARWQDPRVSRSPRRVSRLPPRAAPAASRRVRSNAVAARSVASSRSSSAIRPRSLIWFTAGSGDADAGSGSSSRSAASRSLTDTNHLLWVVLNGVRELAGSVFALNRRQADPGHLSGLAKRVDRSITVGLTQLSAQVGALPELGYGWFSRHEASARESDRGVDYPLPATSDARGVPIYLQRHGGRRRPTRYRPTSDAL